MLWVQSIIYVIRVACLGCDRAYLLRRDLDLDLDLPKKNFKLVCAILVSSGVIFPNVLTSRYMKQHLSHHCHWLNYAEFLHFMRLTFSQFQWRASSYLPAPLLSCYTEPWFAGITQLSASTPFSFTILLLSYELVKAASCPVATPGPFEIGSFWGVHDMFRVKAYIWHTSSIHHIVYRYVMCNYKVHI